MSKKNHKGNSSQAFVNEQQSAKGFWQVVTLYKGQMIILVVYYILLLIISYWSIFDIWSERFAVLTWLDVRVENIADHPLLKPISYTIIGGFLGSLLYNIRQLFRHYCAKGKERYDSHWFGKYITGPWEGGALALIVLAMIRGGVAVFGGSPGADVEPVASFAAFSTGALVGFGMRDVVGWIGDIVETMFTVRQKNDKS